MKKKGPSSHSLKKESYNCMFFNGLAYFFGSSFDGSCESSVGGSNETNHIGSILDRGLVVGSDEGRFDKARTISRFQLISADQASDDRVCVANNLFAGRSIFVVV